MNNPERHLNIASEVRVPEFMAPDQNILDQPPFNWICEDKSIFPLDLFLADHGVAYFIRAWFAYGELDCRPYTHYYHKRDVLASKAHELINPDYRDQDLLDYLKGKISAAFGKYPYSLEYLQEYWRSKGKFTDSGDRSKLGDKTGKILTYAAYADIHLRLERGAKWVGLGEVLPEASAALDVAEAMPQGKTPANKFFRLVCYSEALR